MTQRKVNKKKFCTQKFNDICSLSPIQASKCGKKKRNTNDNRKDMDVIWRLLLILTTTIILKKICFKVKLRRAVNCRSNELERDGKHLAASVQRTWFTFIQIWHICVEYSRALIVPVSGQHLYVF